MNSRERFAAGDIEAFESLFHQFQNEVFVWILRIVRDRAAAEDLTLETFWRIYRHRTRFDPEREFAPWARRIATNLALGWLKRARPRDATLTHDPMAVSTGDPVWDREIRERVVEAFRNLPPKLQAAATLAVIEQVPYPEIAHALGTSVNTVKARVFRSLRLLRKNLRKWGIEP